MDHLQPMSNIDPKDVPDGFTLRDPHGPNSTTHHHATTGSSTNAALPGNGSSRNTAEQQSILEQVMEPDALARLRRIQLVKPAKAQMVENAIVQMAAAGQLAAPITEGKLIEMLERSLQQEQRSKSVSSSTNPRISIQRKKYAMDSDDDDDNDDDLM